MMCSLCLSPGGRRAERAAAAAARSRQEGAPPVSGRGIPPLVSPSRDKVATMSEQGQHQGQGGYFRDGSQLTTFNPRSSYHQRDPRSPHHATTGGLPVPPPPPSIHHHPGGGGGSLASPTSSSSCSSDPRSPRSPPDGLYHATPVRLQHPPPPGRTYNSPTALGAGGGAGGGGPQGYRPTNDLYSGGRAANHQLAGLGLGSGHPAGGHHGSRSHSSSSSSFRPNDVPLQHSASRDNSVLNLNNGAEPYSKDVVV